jgi:hypothetical protein
MQPQRQVSLPNKHFPVPRSHDPKIQKSFAQVITRIMVDPRRLILTSWCCMFTFFCAENLYHVIKVTRCNMLRESYSCFLACKVNTVKLICTHPRADSLLHQLRLIYAKFVTEHNFSKTHESYFVQKLCNFQKRM